MPRLPSQPLAALALNLLLAAFASAQDQPAIHLLRLPAGALQPQAAVSRDGRTAHLVYLRPADPNDASAADVYHTAIPAGATALPPAARVNQTEGGAIATGAVRGAHLALGKGDRPHIAWMASAKSPPGLLYTRQLPDGTFPAERNLATTHTALDGGGSIAATPGGNVHAAWHAPEHKDGNEQDRRVYLTTSSDDGATFSPEHAVSPDRAGACACCGMRLFASGNSVLAVYRGAADMTDRPTHLLRSTDAGQTFTPSALHPMKFAACLMSTAAIAPTLHGRSALVAWETLGRVYVARIDLATGNISAPLPMPRRDKKQKYPAIAVAPDGNLLIAWAEGTGWNKGGEVVTQRFTPDFRPVGELTNYSDLPAFSFPAAWATADGTFHIAY